ncbi:MAG: alanine racemase [Chloroflexi bacterium]|nr:alanine racemase [Chloroflexota bacterium]
MTLDNFGTWLEIDLDRIEQNFHILERTAGCKVMPVVKANAYGHGLEKVALRLEAAGASWFGVARIEEAMLLRGAGIKANILVLGHTSPTRVPHAIKENVTLTVYDFDVAKQYNEQSNAITAPIKVHAKIDTGMGRLGIQMDRSVEFLRYLQQSSCIQLEGIFTHFACADEPDADTTRFQMGRFNQILEQSGASENSSLLIHAANSAGALEFPSARFDMVRTGIAIFGLPPSQAVTLPDGLRPALSWKTRLISVKTLPPGHGVSYGFKYITKKEERIGVIAVGYGDGLRRTAGNQVLIRGKKVDIIGNVCMDQCMVQLDTLPDVQIGDEVVIIGEQNDAAISATDIANHWQTINYEVICGLAARMPRYYLKLNGHA